MKSKTTLSGFAKLNNFTMKIVKNSLFAIGFLTITLMSGFSSKAATITIKDADLGTGTYNWTKDNVYILDGFVFLEAGGVLNIEAGTVIKGKAVPTTADNASALIITVGAKIFAIGSETEPIIFTSDADDVSKPDDLDGYDRGLWGGLVLLGDGILGNSSATSNIEGIPTTEPRGQFGGTNNANNAGTLKYVSIRHGGAELAPGNELNGLTLGGVGSGTILDYIEIIANADDGIEFFGGAVNIKHATTAFCGDDGFDWDMGWVGKGQFWFVLQGSDEGDNGGEWDGAIPDANAVFSNPTVFNLTFIGSGTGSVSAPNTNAILMRDATAGTIGNSIFTEYAHKAIEIEDLAASKGIDSYTRLQNGEIKILNNLWYGFSNYTALSADSATGIVRYTAGGDDKTCALLIQHLTDNKNKISDPMLNGIGRNADKKLDPRPKAGSPALSETATTPSDAFFTSAAYKGAFEAVGTKDWLRGWTALEEYGYLTDLASIGKPLTLPSLHVYPNPTEGMLNISGLNQENDVVLSVYDSFGKMILNTNANTNNGNVLLDVSNLSSGLYILKTSTATTTYSNRVLIK